MEQDFEEIKQDLTKIIEGLDRIENYLIEYSDELDKRNFEVWTFKGAIKRTFKKIFKGDR